LYLLLQNPNKVFSLEYLLENVWSDDVFVNDRTVDVHINRLRKKIIPYDKHIIARLGYGYCFEL
jgi:DNA-binding response OmpR family regulator